MSGTRPKLSGPGQPARDFHIAHESAAGAPGFFNLAGIESPGLTASPAIARMVAEMVRGYLA
jgi:L-2-hydroxyglutarate oxidase LhgO